MLASEAYASLHLKIAGHLILSGLIIQITILDNLDCRQLFPDCITDEVGGIEIVAGFYKLIDLADLIGGSALRQLPCLKCSQADICAHMRYGVNPSE